MLKPGIYKLTKTIINPKPDKRTKRDWLLSEKWAEGDTFVIKNERFYRGDDGAGEDRYVPELTIRAQGSGHYIRLTGWDNAKEEPANHCVQHQLIPALIPVDDKEAEFDWYFIEKNDDGYNKSYAALQLLRQLFVTGKINYEDLVKAHDEMYAEEEEESHVDS